MTEAQGNTQDPEARKRDRMVLVNRERVVYEMIQLACLKIAKDVGVPEGDVDARVDMDEQGKLKIAFDVKHANMEEAKVKEIIAKHYAMARGRIEERFATQSERWHDRWREPPEQDTCE